MSAPRKLIIDTDPGVDDVLSIVLALASKEVEVIALTLTFGNTTLDYACSNILRLGGVLQKHLAQDHRKETHDLLQRTVGSDAKKIPVYAGAAGPIAGKSFTASYFHGRDGLSSVSALPNDPFAEPKDAHPFEAVQGIPACDAILQILAAEPPGTVNIAAVGPLTNLALAWQKDPHTFARVGEVAIMGGALDRPGNTTPTSEFNFFADPSAAAVLLEIPRSHPALQGRPLPLYLLPLDITHQHVIPYRHLVKSDTDLASASPLSRFVSAFLAHPRQVTNSFAPDHEFNIDLHDNFVAHDPLAVAHSIFSSSTEWKTEPREFRIETEGKITRGMCVVDRRGYNKRQTGKNKAEQNGTAVEDDSPFPVQAVVASPGSEWFERVFLERLNL